MAAEQNNINAKFCLGYFYFEDYVMKDIRLAIHYLQFAANQNHSYAQLTLGQIYSDMKSEYFDIQKAIYYFELAAKQNIVQAQHSLGNIYYKIKNDIKRAIFYYSLAAKQSFPESLYNLGIIYSINENKDIMKAIHYFKLAANQNEAKSQFILGINYYSGHFIQKDITKGKYYIIKASNNKDRSANFAHGFLLHEGKSIKRDIHQAIHYYKEASSFNISYAKNNLGIIYKHGFGNEIKKNLGQSIEYFKEAINQKKDYLSMYNLAHIYIFEENIKTDINKSIELLIKSSNSFEPSITLLCITLVKKFNFDIEKIRESISNMNEIEYELKEQIFEEAVLIILQNKSNFDLLYEKYRKQDYLYNVILEPTLSSDIENTNNMDPQKFLNAKNLTNEFYEGFGRDLLE